MKTEGIEVRREVRITVEVGEDEVKQAIAEYVAKKLLALGAGGILSSHVVVDFCSTTYGDFNHAIATVTRVDLTDHL